MRAAGADRAKIFVLAIDTMETSLRIAREVREHFPHLTVFARARNRLHAYQLLDLGIEHVLRDTFASSLELTRDVLLELGLPFSESGSTVERFRQHDEALLLSSHQHYKDVNKLSELALRARTELERLFKEDEAQSGS